MPLLSGVVAGFLIATLLQRRQCAATTDGTRDKALGTACSGGPDDASYPPGSPESDYGIGELPPLTDEQKEALAATAQDLATRGKGILAADESTPTVRHECAREQLVAQWCSISQQRTTLLSSLTGFILTVLLLLSVECKRVGMFLVLLERIPQTVLHA